jgi:hypothetical protein
MCNRLSYKEMLEVCEALEKIEPFQPYGKDSSWWRRGESDRYAYESNSWTLDHRIIDKTTGEEVWSYYTDYYCG